MILEGMITVLVPVYNAAESIVSCMESITVQTYKELEILCIDAGSTDGTVELLGKISEIDSRIRVIHSEKKSYGYQVNLGISDARGEYIGIVEADDVILQDMYERLYNVAKKADADMVRAPYYETSLGKEGEACRRLVHIAPDETVY